MIRWDYSNNQPSSRTIWRQMKRTGWDDQMRDIQTIYQVHVHPGDRWRGQDGMIRWDIFKQLNKFTNFLETDKEDGMGWDDQMRLRDIQTIDQVHVRSRWWMKRMKKDNQMDIQKIDQVHIQAGDGLRGWDGMIRWKASNNWPSSHTLWRQMKRMVWDDQMRDIQTINPVHVPSEEDGMGWSDERLTKFTHILDDRWRGWDRMIRWEIFKQSTKLTYNLEKDEEDRMGWADERYSNN